MPLQALLAKAHASLGLRLLTLQAQQRSSHLQPLATRLPKESAFSKGRPCWESSHLSSSSWQCWSRPSAFGPELSTGPIQAHPKAVLVGTEAGSMADDQCDECRRLLRPWPGTGLRGVCAVMNSLSRAAEGWQPTALDRRGKGPGRPMAATGHDKHNPDSVLHPIQMRPALLAAASAGSRWRDGATWLPYSLTPASQGKAAAFAWSTQPPRSS